jgi:hypothetical protein
MIGAVLGASGAGIAAASTSGEAGPTLAISMAGAGGALAAGLHYLGRAITAWIEADARSRAATAAALDEVRALVADVRRDLDGRRD